MNTPDMNARFAVAVEELDRLAAAICERGYDDIPEEWDNYAGLLQSYEFRKLVTFELYEAYFPPRRHEFELQLLTQLVDAVAASKPVAFLAGAAVGGVVGNAVYDMLKAAVARVRRRFQTIRRTHDAIDEIGENLHRIRAYMDSHDDVRGSQISTDLGIETHKIEPLLKLLGCRSRRIKKQRVWRKPESW